MSASRVGGNRGRKASANGCVDIGSRCRQLMESHIVESEAYARRKIKQVVEENLELECKRASKRRYLENITKRGRRVLDPAIDSLHAIIDGNTNGEKIYMETVERPRTYTSWVPIAVNLDTGSYLDVDHNFPVHLDGLDRFKTAVADYQVYLQKHGKLRTLALFNEARSHYGSKCLPLKEIRTQEAKANAVLQMLDSNAKYAETKYRKVICRNLDITDDEMRVIENHKKEEEAKKIRHKKKIEANVAKRGPYDGDKPPKSDELADEVAEHFCFSCHMFCCEEHDDRFHVKPSRPIRDLFVEKREDELKQEDYNPCSESCWSAKETVLTAREGERWTSEELGVLREMTSIFRFDPCSLSMTIGTRSCREVMMKLCEPYEQYLMERGIAKYSGDIFEETTSMYKDLDDDEEMDADVNDEDDIFFEFMPCNHRGPCVDPKTCRCVKLKKWCEYTCVCKNSRFCVGCRGEGIGEFVDRTHENNTIHGKCTNMLDECTVKGCQCDTKDCGGETCTCSYYNLSCTPGICACTKTHEACNPLITNVCNCKTISSKSKSTSVSNSNVCRTVYCKNIPFSLMKRKRTVLGKSPVHGYGLFAGEDIEKGSFIGAYTGQLVDTNVAELLGFAYDEQGHTFLFDLTAKTVSDGTYLGSKMKFINHGKGKKEGQNCHVRKQFHRGNIHLGMFAVHNIPAGDELRFDYKFQAAIPSWMGGDKVASNSKNLKRRWHTETSSNR